MALISARSPYFISRGTFDDGATLTLNIGHTTSTSAFALLQTYTFSYRKESVINISPLIRDYLTNYDALVINTVVSGTINLVAQSDVLASFIAVDGYGYYEEGYNKDYTYNLENSGYYAGSNPVIYRNRDEPITIPLLNPNTTYVERNANDTLVKFYKGTYLLSTKTTDFGYGSPNAQSLLTDQRIQYITQDSPDSYEERVILDGGIVEAANFSDTYDYLYSAITPDKVIITPPLFDGVLNGDFATDTTWIKLGSATIGGGSANLIGTSGEASGLRQSLIFEDGKKYIVTLDIVVNSGTGVKIQDDVIDSSVGIATTTGSYSFEYTAGVGTGLNIHSRSSGTFNCSVDNVTVTEVDNSYELTIIPVNECRYTPNKLVFTNKHGVEEDLWFFKRSNSNIASTKETYRANTISSYATGDISKHSVRNYNINAKEAITMNTGFIPESFSENIKQMMLSEKVWLYVGGLKTPISIKSSEAEMKKSVNEKLINYEIEIEFAHDVINNIG
jgi:hypothetical protein